jgi:hypothetical protein
MRQKGGGGRRVGGREGMDTGGGGVHSHRRGWGQQGGVDIHLLESRGEGASWEGSGGGGGEGLHARGREAGHGGVDMLLAVTGRTW